jgi:hypothetical protein
MKKSLHLNVVSLDKKDMNDVSGQYWEYYVSGQSLKEYLGISDNNEVSPFGWFNNKQSQKESLQQIRMQIRSELINRRVMLYICAACGDIGCGAFTVKIEDKGDIIVWKDFAYTRDKEEVGELIDVPPLEFDRQVYFSAFTQVR